MPLHSPYSSPEKILGIGNFSCGKSSAWLQIAARLALTKSTAKVYVLDTDDAAKAMVELNPKYSELTNLHITTALDYPEAIKWVKEIRTKATADDWVVCDFVDVIWELAQRYFTAEIFQEDIGAYFLQARKAMAGGSQSLKAFEGWTDWQVINKLYADFANPLFKQLKSNIYCTAKMEEVKEDEKNREIRQLFGSAKVKPTGQKHLGFQFRTIVIFSKIVTGTDERYTITTIKDRERELIRSATCNNFASDYLVKVAGWKMT